MAEYVAPEDEVDLPAFVVFCGHVAPFSSILMFLSPIPTIRNVLRHGTVGDLPLLPYTSMVASCFVWIVYGIMKREPLIWGTNMIEFILSVYYFVEFTNYAPKESPTFPGSVYSHIKLCVGIWGFSLFVAIFFSNAASIIGDLTVLLTILTFASPLAAVKAVLESQSSESVPWPFTLASLFNCVLWTIVGVFEMHDIYVYFPEVLGLLFGGMQVALKLTFGDKEDEDNPSYTRAPVEMPYPVLGSVRQMVMWGNNASNGNNNHYYDNLPQDLQFESNVPSSNADYVELGVPLANEQSQQHFQAPQQPPMPPMNFAQSQHQQTHRQSNEGMEYSTVDGLQTVVFENESISQSAPPQSSAARNSFQSRSGNAGQGHPHGH